MTYTATAYSTDRADVVEIRDAHGTLVASDAIPTIPTAHHLEDWALDTVITLTGFARRGPWTRDSGKATAPVTRM